jgi:hypothetical protein
VSQVEDEQWSYKGLFPYFKRSRKHFDPNGDPEHHGFDGPIHTASISASGRTFPLRDQTLSIWKQLGLKEVSNGNSGHPQGITELVENWRDGKRQIASAVYPLDGV